MPQARADVVEGRGERGAVGNRWEEAEELLVTVATEGLRAHREVQPALVAFAGAALRFVAWLRPFESGAYHAPMTELLALAAPLDCDRLMASFGGRAWSTEAPPPVDEAADHRQRMIVIHAVDGSRGAPTATSALHPFEVHDGGVALGPRWDPGEPAGWVPEALAATVRARDRLRASWTDIARQAARVAGLGHQLYLPPDVLMLIADAVDPTRR